MDALASEKRSSRLKAEFLKDNFDVFMEEVHRRIPIFYFLRQRHDFRGQILEIGAGSAWLSALLSGLPQVEEIYALDLSQDMLETIGTRTVKGLEGDESKIRFTAGDFSRTSFTDKKFDVIVCDAALHHAPDPDTLLKEMNRVLKDDGFLIAIREPIRSVFHDLHWIKFGAKEIEKGANENIYSRKEWEKYFNEAGFHLSISEEFNKDDLKTRIFRRPILRSLNGIFFSRYYFFAKKQGAVEIPE